MYQVVSPSYGRDYKSAKAASADWDAGKDFTCQPSGQQCSIRDFAKTDSIELRYNRLMKLTIVHGK